MAQGIIALDIDGTLVHKHQPLSRPVSEFLTSLHHDGWEILFATGRTIRWSLEHLSALPFPFFLAPYNGACLYSFPDGGVLSSAFMDRSSVLQLEQHSTRFGSVVYEAGGDERILYTEKSFPPPILTHLQNRQLGQNEQWSVIDALADLPEMEVAGIRFFLTPDEARQLSLSLSETTALRAPTMKDSYSEALRIVQVTAPGASKGMALRLLRTKFPNVPAIAAGDDMNDIDLLSEADVGIAMASAPDELKRLASFVSPLGDDGIIEALRAAVRLFGRTTTNDVQSRG
jgi:HAD superfamily hydrolase (TIGR01484 family)